MYGRSLVECLRRADLLAELDDRSVPDAAAPEELLLRQARFRRRRPAAGQPSSATA